MGYSNFRSLFVALKALGPPQLFKGGDELVGRAVSARRASALLDPSLSESPLHECDDDDDYDRQDDDQNRSFAPATTMMMPLAGRFGRLL